MCHGSLRVYLFNKRYLLFSHQITIHRILNGFWFLDRVKHLFLLILSVQCFLKPSALPYRRYGHNYMNSLSHVVWFAHYDKLKAFHKPFNKNAKFFSTLRQFSFIIQLTEGRVIKCSSFWFLLGFTDQAEMWLYLLLGL